MNKNFNILVVDDDAQSALIIEKFLTKQGYKAVSANSAIDGGAILKKDFFDLVITDLLMPEVNGLEFLLWINENSPKTKVIIVTGLDPSQSEIKNFAEQKGAVKYLNKPVNLLELKSIIEKTLVDDKSVQTINYLGLLDFIKISILSKEQKLILVTDPRTDITGSIYIDNGTVIHAEYDNLKGEDAFFKMVTLKTGIFIDKPWVEYTINIPFSELIDNLNKKLLNDKFHFEAPEINTTVKDLTKAGHSKRIVEQAKALEELRNNTDTVKRFTIYEPGVALGIIVGETKKEEVLEIMKKYSKINNSSNISSRMFFYDDISLNVLFDENNRVEELCFGSYYKGSTSKGIKIGDPIDLALKLYEAPKLCTVKGAIWHNFSIFCASNRIITSIKITK